MFSGNVDNIRRSIYLFLLKHSKIDALQRYVRRSGDLQYCNMVAERDPFVIRCVHLGEKNKGIPIFYIKLGNPNQGFCALLRTTMVYLAYCERMGLVPVIEWNREITYTEKNLEERNPYEYYFEQPRICLQDTMESYSVYFSNENQSEEQYFSKEVKAYEQYSMSSELIEELADVSRKYIVLKKELVDELRIKTKDLLGNKKVLGVHFRGTDFLQNYNNHPVGVSYTDYFNKIDEILKKDEYYDIIFLATDDQNALIQFKKKYDKKIVFYKATKRAKGNESVAFSNDERELHQYLLGKEVLQDVVTLSMCQGYIGSMSNVSICASVFNKAYEKKYRDEFIFNKGMNHNSNNFKRPN